MMARFVSGFCLLSVSVWIAGCGSSVNPNAPAKLSGKVTYKSAAVTAGTVTVNLSDGSSYPVPISPDGSYSGFDLPVGDAVITVETESANKKKVQYGVGQGGDKGKTFSPVPEGVQTNAGTYMAIPTKYADKTKSGINIKLERGNNKKDLELVD